MILVGGYALRVETSNGEPLLEGKFFCRTEGEIQAMFQMAEAAMINEAGRAQHRNKKLYISCWMEVPRG
jgi:hypothetical protein